MISAPSQTQTQALTSNLSTSTRCFKIIKRDIRGLIYHHSQRTSWTLRSKSQNSLLKARSMSNCRLERHGTDRELQQQYYWQVLSHEITENKHRTWIIYSSTLNWKFINFWVRYFILFTYLYIKTIVSNQRLMPIKVIRSWLDFLLMINHIFSHLFLLIVYNIYDHSEIYYNIYSYNIWWYYN